MSIYDIAYSGMNSSQIGLNTTANNIANSNTDGYSRQIVDQVSVAGQGMEAGRGSEVVSVRRVTDDFVTSQLWEATSALSYSSSYASSLNALTTLIGSDSYDIATGMDDFFAAAYELTMTPDSIPYRQQLISNAQAVAQQYNSLSTAIDSQGENFANDRDTAIEEVNSQLEGLADLNEQIVSQTAQGENTSVLEDQRDLLIEDLAENLDISTSKSADNSIDITLANGQPLVVGGTAATLNSSPTSELDENGNQLSAYYSDISITFGSQEFPVRDQELGGLIGANQDALTEVLMPAQQTLDEMAIKFADEVNNVLATGFDLNGDPGQPSFTYNPEDPAGTLAITDIEESELALSSDGNPGNGDIAAALGDIENTKLVNVGGAETVTLNDAFAMLTGDVAIAAQQAQTQMSADTALKTQIELSHDSISGVNSDEEAVNLIEYSNTYNANMKVISTANELFNGILAAF